MASPLSEVLGVAIVVVLLWYGSREVFNAKMSPQAFFAFLFAFFQIIEPAKSFATAYYTIQKGMGALERINEVFEIPVVKHSGSKQINSFANTINFENVGFQHDDDAQALLEGLNFTIQKGEIISIEGPSGIGKTTVLQLLLQFLQPTKGSISIDGVQASEIKLTSYRDQIAYVDQQVNILHDTVEDNICLGKAVDQARLTTCLKDAYAWEFVQSLPMKTKQILGDQGSRLSGGQKQRVALARAFYHDAPILILDEATNAVDEESKLLIIKAIQRKNQEEQLTVILVSHDEQLQAIAHQHVELDEG